MTLNFRSRPGQAASKLRAQNPRSSYDGCPFASEVEYLRGGAPGTQGALLNSCR